MQIEMQIVEKPRLSFTWHRAQYER